FSPPLGDRDVISQVDRLSSKETKIARRSVWIAVGASARAAATCMVVSRVGGFSNLTLAERRSLSSRPWDLTAHLPPCGPSRRRSLHSTDSGRSGLAAGTGLRAP